MTTRSLIAAALLSSSLLSGPITLARDSDCSTIDIRDAQPSEVRDYLHTPKDDAGMGDCFAQAAADLLSVKLGVPVSSLDIMNQYYQSETMKHMPQDTDKKNGMRYGGPGGDTADAIYELSGNPVCRESDFPSLKSYNDQNLLRTTNDLAELQTAMKLLRDGTDWGAKFVSGDCTLGIARYFPGAKAAELFEAIHDSLEEPVEKAIVPTLQRLADASCNGKWVSVPDEVEAVTVPDRSQFIAAIDVQLKRKQPTAITLKMPLGAHQVTLVARARRNGVCKYLIRNSWGYGCKLLPKRYSGDCDPKEGAFWLSRAELRGALMDVVYIK